jgi:hypothetical protein
VGVLDFVGVLVGVLVLVRVRVAVAARDSAAEAAGYANPTSADMTTTLHNMNKRNRFIGASRNAVYKIQHKTIINIILYKFSLNKTSSAVLIASLWCKAY